jgi:hypothetical protein
VLAIPANAKTFSLSDISNSKRVRNEVGSREYGNNAPRELQMYNCRKFSRLQLDPTTDNGFTVCGYSMCHEIQIPEPSSVSQLHVRVYTSHKEVQNVIPMLYSENFEERISRKKYTKKENIFS